MATHVWTCQRVSKGKKCGYKNPRRKQLCEKCGKRRPKTKQPAHMAALALDYEGYIALNGKELCGICGKLPSANRRLDRDHDHRTGNPRGLLCANCNRLLRTSVTVEWLEAAKKYLQRTM